jgi:hypothetical protein
VPSKEIVPKRRAEEEHSVRFIESGLPTLEHRCTDLCDLVTQWAVCRYFGLGTHSRIRLFIMNGYFSRPVVRVDLSDVTKIAC